MSTDRRDFIKTASTALGILSASSLFSKSIFEESPIAKFQDNERYWESIRSQFAIPTNMIMANSANLCCAPEVVNRRIQLFINEMNQDVSFQNRAIFTEIRKKALKKLSNYLNVDTSEIGITRNTTESNNIIVNGLELKKGDEILIWDQNHQSNRESWENRARRVGFEVRRISTPKDPKSKEELLRVFENATSAKTRLISFSHISNTTGVALPAEEICTMAKSKGILTLIDGAQALGFLDLDISNIGCDFYTASTHKWLMGPLENGILYVKKEHIDKIWPDSITVFWDNDKTTVNDRFCSLGQRNETTPPAIIDIIDFHNTIGKKNIELRIRSLAAHLKDNLQKSIPNVQFITPIDETLSGGVTIFSIPDVDGKKVFEDLYTNYQIACAPTGGIRLSPTISATLKDMDKIVVAISELV